MQDRRSFSPVRHLEVLAGFSGQRIDNYLVRELKGVPRPLIYRVIRRGEVRVNGARVSAGFRLSNGDLVRVPPLQTSAPQTRTRPPPSLVKSLRDAVLLETPELLIINKPAGVAVHGGSRVEWGVIEVLRALRSSDDRLDLAHRLDRDTSGCLVVAKTRGALRGFQEQLRAGTVEKRYLALLQGRWNLGERRIDTPVSRAHHPTPGQPTRSPRPKRALSVFRPVTLMADASFVEVQIETGRTHQIRLHAAELGHPVAGDRRYGQPAFNRRLAALGLRRCFLHSSHVEFKLKGRTVSVSAPLETELVQLLEKLESG